MGIPKNRLSQHQLGGFQERVVKIKDISEKDMLVYVVDEHKTQFMVPLNTISGNYRLPRIGEFWYMSKSMGQWQLRHMIAESVRNQYYHHHKVEVESIDDGIATVVTTEEKSEKRFKIDIEIRRYKSYQDPQVGETWIIDNALGLYTFAAFVGTVAPPVTSLNGQTGDVTLNPGISQVMGWTTPDTNGGWNTGAQYRVLDILGTRYVFWTGTLTRSNTSTVRPMTSSIHPDARPPGDILLQLSSYSLGPGRSSARGTFESGGGLIIGSLGDGMLEFHLHGISYAI